ncbi:hypothetical protein [uncultured Mucilaginibacter sp.]|uniref:DUF7832 domain-containing protein n=1 Tax=uncultured Mucilaginibacter sp. TaxID=797541 RepID=UPI0025ED08F3|nr:hypothetical protein [uncultured Mucilaginibacter sp.]
MTNYLIKIENTQTHHYRVVLDGNIVSITDGVFYNWLNTLSRRFDSEALAKTESEKLVNEKLKEGYQKTTFVESLENNMQVYDKAKWHFQGDFPQELDEFQGYVHTGFFLGCMIDNDLVSEQFIEDNPEEIAKFKKRELTGPQVFETCCDGVLTIEDINEKGNRFGMHYYNTNEEYINDYINVLVVNRPSVYHVEDTWENYFLIKEVFDKKLSIAQNQTQKKPFWKFW